MGNPRPIVSVELRPNDPTIVKAVLCPNTNREWQRYGDVVLMAEFSDGSIEDVTCWFSDELSFYERSFLGMTRRQAIEYKQGKDAAYLRS